jgi:hypothetical protein
MENYMNGIKKSVKKKVDKVKSVRYVIKSLDILLIKLERG